MEKNISILKTRILEHIGDQGISKRSFYIKTGIANGVLNKETGLTEENIEKYISTYPEINPDWLLTGQGDMYRSERVLAIPATGKKGIPLVGIAAIAGFGSAEFSIEERDVKAQYIVPKFNGRKVDFMLEVAGSSMYPKYNSGDIVACTIIKESTFIQWNKVHVIATKEQGILIKRVKKCSSKGKWLLQSDNIDYDPFEIPIDEVTGLAIVVGVIRLE